MRLGRDGTAAVPAGTYVASTSESNENGPGAGRAGRPHPQRTASRIRRTGQKNRRRHGVPAGAGEQSRELPTLPDRRCAQLSQRRRAAQHRSARRGHCPRRGQRGAAVLRQVGDLRAANAAARRHLPGRQTAEAAARRPRPGEVLLRSGAASAFLSGGRAARPERQRHPGARAGPAGVPPSPRAPVLPHRTRPARHLRARGRAPAGLRAGLRLLGHG